MKKVLISLGLVLILLVSFTLPVFAIVPQGVFYNFDAPENEVALRIIWTGHPDTVVMANEFWLQGAPSKETTIAEVEARITEKVHDLIREDVPWNQLDPEEEAYQGILSPGEEIVVIGPKDYLRVWKAYFAIHIYSLDNLETPESELRFVTRIVKRSVYPGGTTQEEIFPDGWWSE